MRRVLCVVVVLFVVGRAFGQGAVAEVNGSVVDQTGSVIPGATVNVTEENTGRVRTSVSNENGRFVISALTPGRYTIQVELVGFNTQTQSGITIAVGQSVTLNFALQVGGLQDQVTVTGEAPLIEVTQTQLGTNVTADVIESLPMQGREQFSLVALVPGVIPALRAGSFEGTNFNANGRDTGSNLFLVDGQYNKDDRTMTFPQSRVTVDSMAEYQVLTHEYGAEYGGASGVIVNAITKSGTNAYHGRLFSYFQDNSLNATNYFLAQRGEKNPESGVRIMGGNIGGPIVRNKAFFFFNYEYNRPREALNVSFPEDAAPLATSFTDTYNVNLRNYFLKGDYQFTGNNALHVTYIYGPNNGIGENAETERRTRDGFRHERAAPEILLNTNWTSVIGTRMVNELRVGSTKEALWIGDRRVFNEEFNDVPWDTKARTWPGLKGVDPLDFGSFQQHPDFGAGPRPEMTGAELDARVLTEQFTVTAANHTFKVGGMASQNKGTFVQATNQIGTFEFGSNRAFNPADPFSYPIRYTVAQGNIFIPLDTWRASVFAADKWTISNVTLNLGFRYEYDNNTPNTKNGIAPRLGAVYAPNDRTVVRFGFGKFYEYPSTAIIAALYQGRIISPADLFDTGQDSGPLSGRLPAHPCLLPQNNNGFAQISAACRSFLLSRRNQIDAGTFVQTDNVRLDTGGRQLGFLYQTNVGFERQLADNFAVTVDYVSALGRDQTLLLDINEPRLLTNGTIGRPGPSVFDPDGTRVPASARNLNFRRVLEYTTSPDFNSRYDGLEISLDRRMANAWSGRLSYTLSKAQDVQAGQVGGGNFIDKRVNDDLNPRLDYGRTNFDNRHAVSAGGNWQGWRGLGTGFTFRYYSGNPANETVGQDTNGDADGANFDRPVAGRDDRVLPIRSELGANGLAIRNGIQGPNQILLDLRFQYIVNVASTQSLGVFWEIYNATNRVNFDLPIANRRSSQFMQSIVAGDGRSMQIGFRYTF